MPILLRFLRPNPKNGRQIDLDTGLRAPNVLTLFQNIDWYLGQIPREERWNLYYTVADCHEEKVQVGNTLKARQMVFQEYLPIDVDHVPPEHTSRAIEIVCEVLKVDPKNVLSVLSGHGVQVLVQLAEKITDVKYFDDHRTAYGIMCDQITRICHENGMPQKTKADPSIWSNARLMRVPKTINRKEGRPDTNAICVNNSSVPYTIDLNFMFGVNQSGFLPKDYMKKYPEPDTKAVLSECSFLKHVQEEPQDVTEPEWHKASTIVVRLKDGRELFHKMSEPHPQYSKSETDAKLDKALVASGPSTCERIQKDGWSKCTECPHFGKITSPINIKGLEFIATEKMGFHILGPKGQLIPQYEDLRKFYERDRPYFTEKTSGMVFSFNGEHWERTSDITLKTFAYEHFDPKPQERGRCEFRGVIRSTNIKDINWFTESTNGFLNLKNGVLDLKTKELLPHSKDFAFMSMLPYEYSPNTQAPTFEQFLKQVTLDRPDISDVILEFMGYVIASPDCWAHKAALLIGGGSNGKSVLLNLIRALVSSKGYSSIGLKDLQKMEEREPLLGKFVNISEETPTDALIDSSTVKDLISGGEIAIRERYKQAVNMRNKAKLMFACNSLPAGRDFSDGFFRRLLVIPFDFKVTEEIIDPHISYKLEKELPGILNMALAAYDRLWANKRFTKSQAIENKVAEYRLFINDVKQFAQDHLEVGYAGDEFFTPMSKIFAKYAQNQKDSHLMVKGMPNFFKLLKDEIPNYEARIVQKKIGSQRGVRVLMGVRLINDDEFGPH